MANYENIDGSVKAYFKTLKNTKPLTKTEEHKLLKEYKEKNDISARNKLIMSNLKYTCKLASAFRGRGLAYYDLISEANNGLIDAIDKFDIKNNVKLMSYAKWWIMQRMQYAIDTRNKMPFSEIPSENEQSQYFDDDAIDINKKSNYLDIYNNDEIDNNSEIEFLDKIMEKLSENEKDMVNMYYGRNYKENYTLEEIGKKYGITKERVRQIIEKSFKKIRSEALLINAKYL